MPNPLTDAMWHLRIYSRKEALDQASPSTKEKIEVSPERDKLRTQTSVLEVTHYRWGKNTNRVVLYFDLFRIKITYGSFVRNH